MTIGELLKEFFEYLYRLWPFRMVYDWQSGVRCRFGNATKLLTAKNGLLNTGLHTFWPLIGDIIVEETNIEVAQTNLQTVTSVDGVPVTISLGFKYKTFNLKTLYQSVHEIQATVTNEIQATAGRCIRAIPYDDIGPSLPAMVLEEAGAQLAKWGIRVIDINLIDFTKARPIRLIMNAPVNTDSE